MYGCLAIHFLSNTFVSPGRGLQERRKYSGLGMVFYNINEQAFLDYDAPTRKECISFFLKNLSAALFYIRSSLNAKGYGKMF